MDPNTNMVEKFVDKDDAIRDDILLKAQTLFQTYGFRKTTMEDIARAMGKGKSTLYYYYTSKEDIFKTVLLQELQEVFSKTKLAVDAAETAVEKLRAFSVTKITVLAGMINLYRLVFGELFERPICWGSLFNEYDLQETNLISSILSFGIANNEFKPSIEKEMDMFPSIIVSCFRGIERDYFTNKLPGLESRIGTISTLLVEGLKIN